MQRIGIVLNTEVPVPVPMVIMPEKAKPPAKKAKGGGKHE